MTTTQTIETEHVFSHMGAAPYRYLGHRELIFQAAPGCPVRAGGSCDHCGTSIRDAFYFRSADGLEFKVGSSCVRKSGDVGLVKLVSADEAKKRAAKNEAKRLAKMAERQAAADRLAARLADASTRTALAARPHPHAGLASAGKTMLDWAEWMTENAGGASRARVEKAIAVLV